MARGHETVRQMFTSSTSVLAYLLITALAALGMLRLEFDYGLETAFESSGARYAEYQDLIEEFGQAGDMPILVDGIDFSDPTDVQSLLNFVLELQFVDGVYAVLSPFSVPLPDGQNGATSLDALVEPNELAFQRALIDQPSLARFMSVDQGAALVTVLGETASGKVHTAIDQAGAKLLAQGLSYQATGIPAIAYRSQALLVDDFIILNGIGVVLGALITFVALKGIWLTCLTTFTACNAVFWGMGTFGWLGLSINVVSIALPVLLMTLAFSDAIHIGMEQRILAQRGGKAPVRTAIDRIGPAAILTSLTTAGAFATLCLSESSIIRELGFGGGLAVLAACFGGLLANAVAGNALLRLVGVQRVHPPGRDVLNRFFSWHWLPRLGLAAPGLVSALAITTSICVTVLYFTVSSRFSLEENLKTEEPTLVAKHRVEAVFGPTSSMQIPIKIVDENALETVRAVETVLKAGSVDLEPVSILDANEVAQRANMTLDDLRQDLPDAMRRTVLGSPDGRVVVSVPFIYENAAATRAVTEDIERLLQGAPTVLEKQIGRPTGLHVMSSYVSEEMIQSLTMGLITAVGFSGLIIGLWMRSFRTAAISLVPNILPVATIGAALSVSGYGITFSGGIALTLAFGIAVDDTIHVLNRYRLQRLDSDEGIPDPRAAVLQATPAIVLTSVVLMIGLAGTLVAQMPTIGLFGFLAIAVFFFAMISDLLVLPALLVRFGK